VVVAVARQGIQWAVVVVGHEEALERVEVGR
jgi:hypothetical protein